MDNWIDRIIFPITPVTQQPIVVVDSQGYLRIEEIQERLRILGYSLFFSEPGVPARMNFEKNCRGKSLHILIVSGRWNVQDDIRVAAFVRELNPIEIFPNYDSKAVEGLSFNALNTIDSRHVYSLLSYDDTVRFLLENLYNVDLNAWNYSKSKERMLDILISVFKNDDPPNKAISDFLTNMAKPYFGSKAQELCNREKLFEFLNNLEESGIDVTEPMLEKSLANLKIKGLVGNVNTKAEERARDLIENLRKETKSIENRHDEWFELAPAIGELGDLVYGLNVDELEDEYCAAIDALNNRFQIFRENEYEKQFSYSGIRTPITIDKVLGFVNASSPIKKIAFIVIDGMNLWQWHMLKDAIEKVCPGVTEKASFSWLPSITAWARQSVFRGAKPNLEENNSKEDKLFKNYWMNKRPLQEYQISFQKINVAESAEIPSSDVRVAGFVYNALDSMMHGSILGYRQLWQSTHLWIEQSGICKFIESLKENGFDVYITTDHGNVDAQLNLGVKANEKQVSLSRSKRFMRFDTEEQASAFIENHPGQGLAKREKSVYFVNNNGFGKSGETEITHGGSHIMELLIPVGIVK